MGKSNLQKWRWEFSVKRRCIFKGLFLENHAMLSGNYKILQSLADSQYGGLCKAKCDGFGRSVDVSSLRKTKHPKSNRATLRNIMLK